MECTLCGKPISSVDEDGICPGCRENTAPAHGIQTRRTKQALTRNEFEALLSELDELVNE